MSIGSKPTPGTSAACLAFGELEYPHGEWFQLGWFVPRDVCLRVLTDSWCTLLVGE